MRRSVSTALIVLAALAAPARAHQSSMTHARVVVDGDQVRYALQIARPDLAEALGRAPEDAPTLAELEAGAARVIDYVTARVVVKGADAACPVSEGALAGAGGERVEVSWVATCPALATLVIEYDLFFDLDPLHEAVLRVEAGGERADTVLRDGEDRFVWELGAPPPSGLGAFVRSGIDHILYGFDHIAFLLALLLVLVIARDGATWRVRRLGEALRATALIVTSFTVAHSLTLIAASLGWVSVPGQVVESVIALSIAYTAVENVVRPDVRWRHWLTFGFGLLHGLGFARMLEVLLPPDDVVVPLLAFNLGVELGQLAIVVVVMPLLALLARGLGADRYRRLALPALGGVLALLGMIWLVERISGATLLGL